MTAPPLNPPFTWVHLPVAHAHLERHGAPQALAAAGTDCEPDALESAVRSALSVALDSGSLPPPHRAVIRALLDT